MHAEPAYQGGSGHDAPCVAAATKVWVRAEAERVDKDVAEGRIGAALEQLAQVARAARHELGPHAVQAVQAELQQVAARAVVVKEAGGEREEVGVRHKDLGLLVHAHKELLHAELDADVQQVHRLHARA